MFKDNSFIKERRENKLRDRIITNGEYQESRIRLECIIKDNIEYFSDRYIFYLIKKLKRERIKDNG